MSRIVYNQEGKIMKTIYLTIKVTVTDDTDAEVLVENMDYSVEGVGVIETEVVEYEVKQWKS
jgi:DNA-dependent RNA polymerase auxiliary subunit epsilon